MSAPNAQNAHQNAHIARRLPAREADRLSGTVGLTFPASFVDALAARVLERLEETGALAPPAPASWLDVDAAAAYLACKRQRVYDLVSQGRLQVARDGTRLLFRPEWLDSYVLSAGSGPRRSLREAPRGAESGGGGNAVALPERSAEGDRRAA